MVNNTTSPTVSFVCLPSYYLVGKFCVLHKYVTKKYKMLVFLSPTIIMRYVLDVESSIYDTAERLRACLDSLSLNFRALKGLEHFSSLLSSKALM